MRIGLESMAGFKRLLWAACFHTLVALPLALVVGGFAQWLIDGLAGANRLASHFWLAPAVAVVFGFGLIRRDGTGVLAFGLPAVVFLASWYELYHAWSPSWSKLSRTEYVKNNLFGPSCGDTECLYAMAWALLLPAIFYSLGAFTSVLLRRRLAPQDHSRSVLPGV